MIRWRDIAIDRQRGRIIRHGFILQFAPQSGFFRLACALLLAGPCSKEDLFLHVYAEREDGGPLGGIRTFDVLMCLLRKRLLRIGIELHADAPWSWHRKRYWAVPMVSEAQFLEAAE